MNVHTNLRLKGKSINLRSKKLLTDAGCKCLHSLYYNGYFVSTDYKVAKVAFWFVPGFRV